VFHLHAGMRKYSIPSASNFWLALIFIIKEGGFLHPTLKSANQLEQYYLV